jgi:diketogulonate reductase-like aldo/keto reductase
MSLFGELRLGLGTWQMGERTSEVAREVMAVEHALEVGYRLIDTAEMYADGGAETIIGQALKGYGLGKRENLSLVSKVLPMNASRQGTLNACERSLKRMGLDYLDVYLLHWPGSHPIEQTIEAFIELKEKGRIRAWGISNFDLDGLRQWLYVEERLGLSGGVGCSTNQVFFGLKSRGPEFDLLPAMQALHMPLMAYTPLGSGALADHQGLVTLAKTLGCSAAQLALAWAIHHANVVAIPKSSTLSRIDENFGSLSLNLTQEVLSAIDALFPPPQKRQPLAVI